MNYFVAEYGHIVLDDADTSASPLVPICTDPPFECPGTDAAKLRVEARIRDLGADHARVTEYETNPDFDPTADEVSVLAWEDGAGWYAPS